MHCELVQSVFGMDQKLGGFEHFIDAYSWPDTVQSIPVACKLSQRGDIISTAAQPEAALSNPMTGNQLSIFDVSTSVIKWYGKTMLYA